ncbi:unnamed protein product [Discosporangium mesarthrocarpum]
MASGSRLCFWLFLPTLIAGSIGATLTPAIIADSWHLLVASIFTIIVSWFLAGFVRRIFLGRDSVSAFRPIQVAISFTNCAVLPLLLLESLCEQAIINSNFEDRDECFDKATGMIFVYVICWQVCFYAWGYHLLGESTPLEGTPSKASLGGKSHGSSGLSRTLLAPVVNTESPAVVLAAQEGNVRLDDTVRDTYRQPVIDPRASFTPPQQPRSQTQQQQDSVELNTTIHNDEPVRMGGIGVISEVVAPSQPKRTGSTTESCLEEGQRGEGGENKVCLGHYKSASKETVVLFGEHETGRGSSDVQQNGKDHGRVARMDASGQGGKEAGETQLITWEERGRKFVTNVLLSPGIVAVLCAIVMVMVPSLQRMLFHNPKAALRPLGAAVQVLICSAVVDLIRVVKNVLCTTMILVRCSQTAGTSKLECSKQHDQPTRAR